MSGEYGWQLRVKTRRHKPRSQCRCGSQSLLKSSKMGSWTLSRQFAATIIFCCIVQGEQHCTANIQIGWQNLEHGDCYQLSVKMLFNFIVSIGE